MFVSQITVDRQGSKQGNFPILVCLYVGDRVDSSLKDMAIVMKQLDVELYKVKLKPILSNKEFLIFYLPSFSFAV